MHMFNILHAFPLPETVHDTSKTYSLSNYCAQLAPFPLTPQSGVSEIHMYDARVFVVPKCTYDTIQLVRKRTHKILLFINATSG